MKLAENQASDERAPKEQDSCARTGSQVMAGSVQKLNILQKNTVQHLRRNAFQPVLGKQCKI